MLRTALLAVVALSSSIVLGACAQDVTDEDVAEGTDGLTQAGRALIGAYKDDDGVFRGLVLTAEAVDSARNRFFADVDTGVHCPNGSCSAAERLEGTFTATAQSITLESTSVSPYAEHLLGTYFYRVEGAKLTLFRAGFQQTLEKGISHCAAPTDCERQSLMHPACVGAWTCGAQKTCGWQCGAAPATSCAGLGAASCEANPRCKAKYGPSACTTDGTVCTNDRVFKSCEDAAPSCSGLAEAACEANPACESVRGGGDGYGACWPSHAFRGCRAKQAAPPPPPPSAPSMGTVCFTSAQCGPGQRCSTEQGTCNRFGPLPVCTGFCVAR